MSVRVLPPPGATEARGLNLLLPLNVADLLRFFSVSAGAGRVKFRQVRGTYLIPASTPAAIIISGELNRVISVLRPVQITTDYYSPDLWAWVVVDSENVLQGQLTDPIHAIPELFWGKTGELYFGFDNQTHEDASVTLDMAFFDVDVSFWRDVVIPTVDCGYGLLKDAVRDYLLKHGGAPVAI